MIHLHTHSYFSLRRGVPSPEQLVERGVEQGQSALALTDTGGLYGAVRFYKACREAGIKPIIGVELPGRGGKTVFLARNIEGYRTLCRLVTRFHLEDELDPARLEPEHFRDLFVLSPDCELLKRLAPLNQKTSRELPPVWALLERFPSAPFYAKAQRLQRTAQRLHAPLVAAGDVHFLSATDYAVHRALRAIDCGVTLDRVDQDPQACEVAPADAWMKSPSEMQHLYRDLPDTIQNSSRIAEACNLELPLGQTEYPLFPLPPGETAFSQLWKACFEGAQRRYHPLRPEVIKRLEYELSIIEEKSLAAYFLIVRDIVQFCERERIPCVGRGSAADSLVSYVLGITHGCPLEHDLYFERFLNRERQGAPDIDLDLCWRSRDRVLEYVYKRYGSERVAMICTYNTFCARSALRESAKVFGLPAPEINRLVKRIPHFTHMSKLESENGLPPEMRGFSFKEDLYGKVLKIARAIDGFPRHLAMHPCGIVIGARPLTDKVPLQRAAKGFQIAQYDMHGVEDVGLLKIDLLGQRSLSVIADVVRIAADKFGKKINLNGLPPHDKATYATINRGRTVGCFQLESPGMRSLLQKLNTDCLETLIASISVIRPGPNDAGMMRHYVDRHNGKEPVTYLDPRLEPILKSTYGILLYQEDVLKVASAIAGMSLGEADVFRRAMTKLRTPDNMAANHARFIEGALAGGTSAEVAEELWRQVSGFAGYAFCKAHSVSYGILAYQSAFLKVHFPAEFMAAVINNGGGFYSTAVYVEESRRLGLRILPPDLNLSEKLFTSTGDAIRAGLGWVRDLSGRTLQRLFEERQKRPFASLADFVMRVRPDRREADSLVRCGAADEFGQGRREQLWQMDLAMQQKPRAANATETLFAELDEAQSVPISTASFNDRGAPLRPLTLWEKVLWERELLGFTVSAHPIACLRSRVGAEWTKVDQLRRQLGKRVKVGGVIRTAKRTRTKSGELMKFVTLEDETGLIDAVFFPQAYQRCVPRMALARFLEVTGRAQDDCGSLTITAESVRPLEFSEPAARTQ